jgi:hypothetical protein
MIKLARSVVILTVIFLTVGCSHVATTSSVPTRAALPSWNMETPQLECITPDDVAQNSTKLPDQLQQGQHIIAYAVPGSRVIYNGRELAVTPNGRFELDILSNASNLLKLNVFPEGQPPGIARFWVYPASKLSQSTNAVSQSQLASG